MSDADTAALVLRVALGTTMVAHGLNHGWGPGGLRGTASWFESIGLRPPLLHAAVSAYLEVAAGVAILVGLLVPVAAAAAVGVMVVAFVTVHRPHGFFIFKDGYEYVAVVAFALTALAVLGAGRVSLDHALGLHLHGPWAGVLAAGGGVLGAALLLVTSWRPRATSESS